MTAPTDVAPAPDTHSAPEQDMYQVVLRPCDVPAALPEMLKLSEFLAQARVLPEHYHGRPADVLAVMWQAKALDIPLMVALQHCYVLDGKVHEEARLQHALARRAGHRFKIVDLTDKHAVINAFLAGEVEPHQVVYRISEAAHLIHKKNWKQNPKEMLWARCITRAVTLLCPEVLLGMSWSSGLGPDEDTAGNTLFPDGSDTTPPSAETREAVDQVLLQADEITSLEDPKEARTRLQRLWRDNTALLDVPAHEDGAPLREVLQDLAEVILARIDGKVMPGETEPAAGNPNDSIDANDATGVAENAADGTAADPEGIDTSRSPGSGADDHDADSSGSDDLSLLDCGCLAAHVIAHGAHQDDCPDNPAPAHNSMPEQADDGTTATRKPRTASRSTKTAARPDTAASGSEASDPKEPPKPARRRGSRKRDVQDEQE